VQRRVLLPFLFAHWLLVLLASIIGLRWVDGWVVGWPAGRSAVVPLRRTSPACLFCFACRAVFSCAPTSFRPPLHLPRCSSSPHHPAPVYEYEPLAAERAGAV
jgi:hypothetical protein